MAAYTAIADVGETLIYLLRENMEDLIPQDSIVLVSPGEIDNKDNIRLSLFLYKVSENAYLKNRELEHVNSKKLQVPPLILDLCYMLTSYPSSGIQDKTERTKEEHSVLGRGMQVLNSNTVLKGSVLRGSLAEYAEELHISTTAPDMEELTKIWSTFQEKPFRPTVCYQVTPVTIESTLEKNVKRVVKHKLEKFIME